MPIFTYICKDCGQKFDLLIGVNLEKARLKCIKCDSKNIEKSLSAFSVGNAGSGDSCSTGSCPTGTCPTGF